MVAPNRRRDSGRKKTVVRRIEQKDARHVCYSKRRAGFFKKASDLAVLTGAEVAALAFSPGGNVFAFGHPSIDSVVERFLAGQGAGAGARGKVAADDRLLAGEGAGEVAGEGAGAGAAEGAAGEDKKLEKLHQEFAELGTELVEVKKRAERTEEAMAKERAAGDQIAAWFGPNVGDIGDEDMAAFFAALMQVKEVVSDRANDVLLEAMHLDVSRMAQVAAPTIFGGSTFEFGSSSGTANDGMEFQYLVPPPQEQGFEAGMDMQQMVMAALPPSQVVAAGMDMQQQTVPSAQWVDAGIDIQQQVVMELPPSQGIAAGINMQVQQQIVMELPPAQGVAAGMNMQEMPPPPGFATGIDMDQRQMAIPQPPGFDDDMWMEIQELLMAMPPSP